MLNNKSLLLAAGGKSYTPFVKTHEISVGNNEEEWGFSTRDISYGSLTPITLDVTDMGETFHLNIDTLYYRENTGVTFGFEEGSELPSNTLWIYIVINKDNNPKGIHWTIIRGELKVYTEEELLTVDNYGENYEVYISQNPPTFKWTDITYNPFGY